MHQHFKCEMECGHFYQVSAVLEYEGRPYEPDYVGQTMPARCCSGSHKVKKQMRVDRVVGQPTVME